MVITQIPYLVLNIMEILPWDSNYDSSDSLEIEWLSVIDGGRIIYFTASLLNVYSMWIFLSIADEQNHYLNIILAPAKYELSLEKSKKKKTSSMESNLIHANNDTGNVAEMSPSEYDIQEVGFGDAKAGAIHEYELDDDDVYDNEIPVIRSNEEVQQSEEKHEVLHLSENENDDFRRLRASIDSIHDAQRDSPPSYISNPVPEYLSQPVMPENDSIMNIHAENIAGNERNEMKIDVEMEFKKNLMESEVKNEVFDEPNEIEVVGSAESYSEHNSSVSEALTEVEHVVNDNDDDDHRKKESLVSDLQYSESESFEQNDNVNDGNAVPNRIIKFD